MRKSFGSAADVAVVGGGVAGLSAARELARRGLSVTVVESRAAGAGASSAAAGMLAPQAEADHPDELFELLCASRELYPDFAARLREESGIDVELDRTGTLYLAFDEHDEREAGRRFEWQSRAGLAVERLTAEEARGLEPQVSTRVRSALRFPRDWQVENRQLVRALAASAAASGARLLEGVEVHRVVVEGGRAAGVETSGGTLKAGAVVLAAGAWSSLLARGGDEGAADAPRVEPVRGQVLCFRQDDARAPFVRHVVYSPRGYVVPRRDGRLLAGSTTERAGFDCRVTPEGAAAVRAHAEEIAPAVSSLALADAWAGLRPRAADGLPVVGESAEVRGLFYATGYYRNGILLAPVTGEILADLVTSGTTRLSPRALSAFSPARFRPALAGSHAV
ncbi:MAG TPA: glycine oxidase ThiO [Pyrinomonadaceae bacterium]|jgi:glycine oxidase